MHFLWTVMLPFSNYNPNINNFTVKIKASKINTEDKKT